MLEFQPFSIAKIEDDNVFEDLCEDLFKTNGLYENIQKNGRSGQKQDGVDIFARKKDTTEWIGIQCKVRGKGTLTQKEIEDEIKKGLEFNPKLTNYYIYTTAQRDVKIQEVVRVINNQHLSKGLFSIEIIYWEDIEQLLKEDRNKAIHYKYYRGFFTKIKEDGFAHAKLIRLLVGWRSDVSQYELLIGKTYQVESEEFNGINYWKNCNFIMNFNERGCDTFPIPCYPSDIDKVIECIRDRDTISKWLSTIKNMDEFLQSKEIDYSYIMTDEEFEEYLGPYQEDDEWDD